MTRLQYHDTTGIFSPQDDADMELRFTRIAVEEINSDFDTFTHEQGADLLAISRLIDEMLERVRQ